MVIEFAEMDEIVCISLSSCSKEVEVMTILSPTFQSEISSTTERFLSPAYIDEFNTVQVRVSAHPLSSRSPSRTPITLFPYIGISSSLGVPESSISSLPA